MQPPCGSCFGYCEIFAVAVAMPETAVDEDDCFVFGQHDVGMAGELFIMQPVAKALRMQILPHEHLGLGVAAFYLRHIVAARSLAVHIGHDANVKCAGRPVV